MGNKRYKSQQGIRLLSGCKTGMKFSDSILVRKCVVLRTFYGNQGACGMFSGSWNKLKRSDLIGGSESEGTVAALEKFIQIIK